MKKSFRFLALGFALMCGTLSSFASVKPAAGTVVGQTVSEGVVTYVVQATGTEYNYKAKNKAGDEVTVTAYPVMITGLDYDGLTAKSLTELNIKTSFTEKSGTELNGYYVVGIIDTNPTDKGAFYAMRKLQKLVFEADENGLSEDKFDFYVGDYAFFGCDALATLTFPYNVSRIGNRAFEGTKISSFEIPNHCGTLGAYAFNDTKSLITVTVGLGPDADKKLTVPNTKLTTIAQQVFANSSVSELNLTNAHALKSINDQAFIHNASDVNAQLTTVILPKIAVDPKDASKGYYNIFNSLGAAGTCFANCMELATITNLDISEVTEIQPGAFQNCEKLTQLDFPKTASIKANGVTSPFLNTPKLKKITFAGGWRGTINPDVYLSTAGKKIKYSGGAYTLEDYTIAPTSDIQKKELTYLEEIEFKGKVYGAIGNTAFGNPTATLACSGLKTLTFGGLICQPASIGTSAFENCAALATLTFNGFKLESYDVYASTDPLAVDGNITINPSAFKGTGITAVAFGGFTLNGYNDAHASITISGEAFAADKLASVSFGDIVYQGKYDETNKKWVTPSWNRIFALARKAFVSDALKKVTFGKLTAFNTTSRIEIGIGSGDPVFVAKNYKPSEKKNNVLEEVKFGKITAGVFAINNSAFASEPLKSVEIGDITTPTDENGWLTIDNFAFGWSLSRGETAQAKSVVIGAINPTKDTGTPTLTVGFGNGAFQGDLLSSVKIGDITGATNVTFNANSFGNTMPADDTYEPLTETVTIGQLAAETSQTFTAGAFAGPQQKGSEFSVTIKAAKADDDKNFAGLKTAATIPAGTFVGPAIGTTSYELGDIDNTTSVAAKAFQGSQDETAQNTTSVTIGNYNSAFPSDFTFTNVNDLSVKSWNVASNIGRFQDAVTVTIEKNVTNTLAGADMNSVKELYIGGNVTDAGKIKSFGNGVRLIAFTSKDPKVLAGAIKEGAFTAASTAAKGKDETISVIYRVENSINSNNIFETKAFGVDDAYQNVILYTDDWSKSHIYQNVDVIGAPGHIYHMTLSASEVAPGEDILASCTVGASGSYAYGRLYVPAGTGMRYKIAAKYNEATDRNAVNLFSASISGENIYINPVTPQEGYYWIDATETDQVLIVRTSEVASAEGGKVIIEAEGVTEQEAKDMDDEGTVQLAKDWFDAASATKNDLRYATTDITPTEFQNDATTHNKGIYVMANPATRNLAFAKYDQTKKGQNALKKGNVYVVSRADIYSARLNVIWPEGFDEESDATAIQTVKNSNEGNGDAIYTLSGVRVKNAQKGIYIINGKKVIK